MQRVASRREEGAWLAANLLVKASGALAATVAVGVLAVAVHYPAEVRATVPLVFPYLLFSGLNGSLTAYFQGHRRSIVTAGFIAGAALAYFAGVLATAWAWPTVAGFLVCLGGYEALIFALQANKARATVAGQLRLGRATVGELLLQGWPVGLVSVLSLTYFRLDVVLLQHLRPADVANYFVTYKIAEVAVLVAAAVSGSVLTELGARVEAGTESVARLVHRAASGLIALMLAVEAAYFAVGGMAAGILFGARFEVIQPALVVLAAAAAMIAANMVLTAAIISVGRQRWLVPLTATNILVNLGLNLYLIPRHGYLGAAWATAGSEAVNLALQATLCWSALRHAPLRVYDVGAIALALGVAAVAATAAGGNAAVRAAVVVLVGVVVVGRWVSRRR